MSFGPTRQRRINLFVSASFQILDIQQYASGLQLGRAARVPAKPLGEDGILNQNPIFEMGSSVMSHKYVTKFMWDILVHLSSLQVSGRWLLASGSWSLAPDLCC